MNLARSSSRAAAVPESTAVRASSSPSRRSSACPAGCDRAGGIEQDRVASAAVRARKDLADRLRVLGRRAAAQLSGVAALDAELERVDHAWVHLSVDDLADVVRPGRRELVDPEGAVDDEGAAGAELRQHVRDRLHERLRVDADHLGARAGGVRERAEHVEHGTRGELAADGGGVTHRRVVRRREHEAEPELVDRLRDPLRRLLELEAERFEHVRRSGRRGDGAVPVLGDARAGRRGDDRSRGRDVDRAGAVAARARRVDEVVALRMHRQHVVAHRLRAAGDLVRGLALQAQRDEEAAHLRRGGVAAHDLAHHLAAACAAEVLAVEQVGQRLLDQRRSRKFRPSSGPSGVSTDSGWNWTPSIGSARWRTPITSPSGVRAVISSSSGTVSAASEW